MVGERRGRRQRVLDRRELAYLLRRTRTVAVVKVVAEEVLVVLIVPGIALGGRFGGRLLLLLRGFRRLKIFGRNLLEHRVFDHFLIQEIGKLERRHRQQLDGLLQRRRQNQLLNEFGVKPLLRYPLGVLCRLNPLSGAR